MTARVVRLDDRRRDGGAPWTMATPAVEALLPEQLAPGAVPLSPERRLLWAVLVQAVADLHLRRNAGGRRRHGGDPTAWFLDRDDEWVFGFESICDELGLDADAVRTAIFGGARTAWWGRAARRA